MYVGTYFCVKYFLYFLLPSFLCDKSENFFLLIFPLPRFFFNTYLLPSLTLSLMAQVICDLAFFNDYSSKILSKKYSEKNHSPGEVFSLYVLLQDFSLTMMSF
jgi:hypothetical protein